ncbi:MAG: ABC transporter permease subunit [Hyphomicrobiales bacterium]
MRQNPLIKLFLAIYLVIFFGYLLGPLIIMGITAFNSPSFPKAAPWECLTFEWFSVLANDERIMNGIKNSFLVGSGTVTLSVIIGLAGALVLTQVWPKLRPTYYTVVIAPILIPGVVLGISTLVFWGRFNTMLGLSDESILQNGLFLTILGQTTFIASYCMLVFVARLQRFDSGLTEAALDLGATHVQAFRKIMLPFLYPAIGSAAVLAFLASFENYNTTTFTFGKYPTLTIELAQKVRYGINPSISALAVIIVGITIVGALVYEVHKRRQAMAIANGAPPEAVAGLKLPKFFSGNPAAIVLALVLVSGIGTVIFAQVYSPDACKVEVREEKRKATEERIRQLQERTRQQKLQENLKGPDIFAPKQVPPAAPPSPKPQNPGSGTFGDVFNPGNLDETGPNQQQQQEQKKDDDKGSSLNPGSGAFGNVFAPKNLNDAAGTNGTGSQ